MNIECMKKSGFNFTDWEKASIQEFGYILSVLSDGKYKEITEDNLENIAIHSKSLLKAIDEEFQKEQLTEQIRLNIDKDTAMTNLNNMKNIIISIKKYIDCVENKA